MPLQSFLKTLGKNVSKARKERKLTQREVASLAKIPSRYLQRIEAGSVNMTLSTLLRLSLPLAVHPCDLMPKVGEWENKPFR